MDVRGIGAVVQIDEVVTGRFYRRREHRGRSVLFQAVEEEVGGTTRLWGLHFHPQADSGPQLEELYANMRVVEIPDVHLRIDPESLMGDEFSNSSHAGMLLVTDSAPVILATPPRGHGWIAVNMSTGKTLQRSVSGWAWFSRWSLVVDNLDEEIELVAFDLEQRA